MNSSENGQGAPDWQCLVLREIDGSCWSATSRAQGSQKQNNLFEAEKWTHMPFAK